MEFVKREQLINKESIHALKIRVYGLDIRVHRIVLVGGIGYQKMHYLSL